MPGRIRTLKPEILENARTAQLDDEAWRCFVSMLLLADDYGNLYGDPDRICGSVFWARPSRDSREILARLSDAGLVTLYGVRGQLYATVIGWKEHQKVDKPGRPRVPDISQADTDVATIFAKTSRQSRETLARSSGMIWDLGSGISDLGSVPVPITEALATPATPATNGAHAVAPPHVKGESEPKPKPIAFDWEAIYAHYPRKIGKAGGLTKLAKQITTQADYDTAMRGVQAYAVAMRAERRPVDKIPHFSTWVNQELWRDYANPDATSGATGAAAKSNWREPGVHTKAGDVTRDL